MWGAAEPLVAPTTTPPSSTPHASQLGAELWRHFWHAARIPRHGGRLKQSDKNLGGQAAYLHQCGRARQRVPLAAEIRSSLHVLVVGAQLGAKGAGAALHQLPHTFEGLADARGRVSLEAAVEIVHQQVSTLLALKGELD